MQEERVAASGASTTDQFERLRTLRMKRNTIKGEWEAAMIAMGRTEVDCALRPVQADSNKEADRRIID